MRFCTNCGAQLEDDAVFCANCGTKAETAPEAAETQTVCVTVENTESAPEPQPVCEDQPNYDKPDPRSRYALISGWGYLGNFLLLSIPFVGFVLAIVWACGGCHKTQKRNLARGVILYYLLSFVLSIVLGLLTVLVTIVTGVAVLPYIEEIIYEIIYSLF